MSSVFNKPCYVIPEGASFGDFVRRNAAALNSWYRVLIENAPAGEPPVDFSTFVSIQYDTALLQLTQDRPRRIAAIAAVLSAALLASGCAGTTVYEAAVGVNVTRHTPWSQDQDGGYNGGRGDTVRFTVRRENLTGNRFCAFSHHSGLSRGWPVNAEAEDWFDVAECGVSFGGGGR